MSSYLTNDQYSHEEVTSARGRRRSAASPLVRRRVCCTAALLVMLSPLLGCYDTPTPPPTPDDVAAATGEGSKAQSASSETSATDQQEPDLDDSALSTDEPPAEQDAGIEWGPERKLLATDSLAGWEEIGFGGVGDCEVSDGVLAIGAGDPMCGVSSTLTDLPTTNYEIALQAKKVQGVDFFCGLTFPVDQSHCTLIVGGWGGSTVGLSCIDEKDAARNDTAKIMAFEKDRWYAIRVRVQPENISVWIDDQQVVDQSTVGHEISLRGDTKLCRPLGLCSFMTDAEIKEITLRTFQVNGAKAE